jgi:uncharacterized repeat protein (TIGR02543 family)
MSKTARKASRLLYLIFICLIGLFACRQVFEFLGIINTVTYDGNGATTGSVPIDDLPYVRGQTVTVLGNTGNLGKTGQDFAGWNTRADGLGSSCNAGVTFTMGNSNVTLYALWTATATYDSNGAIAGTVPTDTNTYVQGQTVWVLGNSGGLTKPPCGFTGWNTQADGSGTTYNAGQSFTMGTSNVTLYATWVPIYTVLYNANGAEAGAVPIDSTEYRQGQMVKVLGNTGSLVKAGWAFAGWNTQVDGKGTTYNAGQSFSMGNSDAALYAKWILVYTVTYSENDATAGTVPIDSTEYIQGQTVPVLGNTGNLIKTGCVFNGWNTQADGTGTTYKAGQTLAMGSSSLTLYAKWTVLTPFQLVSIDAAGDTFTMGDGTYGPNISEAISYSFQMSKYEITNSQFAQFIAEGGYSTQSYWTTNGWAQKISNGWTQPHLLTNPGFDGANQPVTTVSWYEAVAFCNWLSAKEGLTPAYNSLGQTDVSAYGYRLPTEVEWEYAAAKGASNQTERIYTYGDTWDSSRIVCCVYGPKDVGSKSPGGDTPQGLVDMSGNAAEMCSDNFQSDASIAAGTDRYYFSDDSADQVFCTRGGYWLEDMEYAFRCADRGAKVQPSIQYYAVGFRVVRR